MSNLHKFSKSSSIEHCDYLDDKNTLEIKFTSGAIYHYPNCPKTEYDALKAAASPGLYFHKNVRKYNGVKQ